MTEPRTDHRVPMRYCGHEDRKNWRDGASRPTCGELKKDGQCPDKECMGWVD